jgi:hypothetical protein
MFICKCENIFEKATELDMCPFCGAEDFVEAAKCEECNTWVDDDSIHYHEESDSMLCSECHHSEINRLSPQEEYYLSEFLCGWDEYKAS